MAKADPATPGEPKSWRRRVRIICQRIPLVNFFTFWVLTTPSAEAIEKVLNTVGIVDALMLALVVGMSGTTGYAELRAADDRVINGTDPMIPEPWGLIWTQLWFRGDGGEGYDVILGSGPGEPMNRTIPAAFPYDWAARKFPPPSYNFYALLTWSTMCFAASLLVIVMIYVYLLTADIDKLKEGEEMSEEESTKAQMEMAEWYTYSKFPIVSAIVLFIIGLVIFFNAMVQLIIIKSPDYRFLASNGGNLAGDSLYLLPGICGYVLLALVLLAVIFCGWGNYAVLALNRYGTRQSVLHVIFFFPRKTGQQVAPEPQPDGAASKLSTTQLLSGGSAAASDLISAFKGDAPAGGGGGGGAAPTQEQLAHSLAQLMQITAGLAQQVEQLTVALKAKQ